MPPINAGKPSKAGPPGNSKRSNDIVMIDAEEEETENPTISVRSSRRQASKAPNAKKTTQPLRAKAKDQKKRFVAAYIVTTGLRTFQAESRMKEKALLSGGSAAW